MHTAFSALLLFSSLCSTLSLRKNQPDQREVNDWALTEDEIAQTRQGIRREASGISTFTTHNKVELLIEGSTFMASLYHDLEQTPVAISFMQPASTKLVT